MVSFTKRGKEMCMADADIKGEVLKVRRKIPTWFKKPTQINSQILISFLKLRQKNRTITTDLLKSKCKGIKTFRENYNQMKIISEKNHGKVFSENNGYITLWPNVSDFIMFEFSKINGIRLTAVP